VERSWPSHRQCSWATSDVLRANLWGIGWTKREERRRGIRSLSRCQVHSLSPCWATVTRTAVHGSVGHELCDFVVCTLVELKFCFLGDHLPECRFGFLSLLFFSYFVMLLLNCQNWNCINSTCIIARSWHLIILIEPLYCPIWPRSFHLVQTDILLN